VDYPELANDDNALDDVADESWISGVKPLSKNVMEAELSDYNAHAWVEIYKDGIGWVTVDPTPYVTKEEMEEENESGNVLSDMAEYFKNTSLLADGFGRAMAFLGRIILLPVLLAVMFLLSLAIYYILARPLLACVLCLIAVHSGNIKKAVLMKYDYISRLAVYCGVVDGNNTVFCRELCEALTKLGMNDEKAGDMCLYIEKALYSKVGVDSDTYKLICSLTKEARRCILKASPIHKRVLSVFAVVLVVVK
jgi:hypothetical protein